MKIDEKSDLKKIYFFAYLDAFRAGIPKKKCTGPLGADFLWARGLVDLAIFRGRGPKNDENR